MRHKKPDRKNALSIVDAAKKDMEFTLTLKATQEASATIIRNIYECFRMLGDALLVSKGIKSTDHIIPIRELLKLRVSTSRPIFLIENLRQLRHNINYYGYSPKLVETEDVISIAKSCFKPLYKVIIDEINRKN
jgi:hypothetical protein